MSAGAVSLALIVLLAIGFAGVVVALWFDANEADEREHELRFRREVSRLKHPAGEWCPMCKELKRRCLCD